MTNLEKLVVTDLHKKTEANFTLVCELLTKLQSGVKPTTKDIHDDLRVLSSGMSEAIAYFEAMISSNKLN